MDYCQIKMIKLPAFLQAACVLGCKECYDKKH